jgi:hypothetical protein
LPIVILYGGASNLNRPAREDDDNIIAALKQSRRVSSISLTATSSIFEKLSAISEPFSELEKLTLLSQDSLGLTLSSNFRWGPRLHTLHLTKIAFPSLPSLLSPCHDIVDLQLLKIPISGYFSPESFANSLSRLTQLRSLSLHLLSFPHRRSYVSLTRPPEERISLPALTNLKYRGTSKYLDILVARIDAPCLGDIGVTFFYQPTVDASQIGRFIERIEMQLSLCRADVQTSAQAISISFTDTNTSTRLRIQISCKQLDWQLSSMAQVCDQFSPFLPRIKELDISTTESSTGRDYSDGEQWLELVHSFNGVTTFRVAGEVTTDILCVLGRAGAEGQHTTDTTVLPALRNICLQKPLPIEGGFWDASPSFITSRELSGRPVQLQLLCSLCDTGFTQLQGLKTHLLYKHTCRTVCSYCGDFEYNPGRRDLFRDHLKSKHFEVTRNNPLVTTERTIYAPELRRIVDRHSSLYAPDVVKSSIMATVPQPEIVSDTSEIITETSDDDPLDLTYFT